MDMMTLALAKKYTDEKVGGGSGGGLPVVEITSAEYPASVPDIVLLTEAETAQLSAALETGLPAVIKFTANGIPYSAVAALMFGIAYSVNIMVGEDVSAYTFTVEDGKGIMGG